MIPSANPMSTMPHGASERHAKNPFRSTRAERWVRGVLVGGGLLAALAILILYGGRLHPHAPHLGLLARQPIALQVHVGSALAALLLGTLQLLRPKGRALHRVLGWTWVAAMLATAASSFLFPSVLTGHLSPIHGLSAWVLLAVPMGLAAVRSHDIGAHRRWMTNIFMFGLIVAGAFTFIPGRLMWRMFFG